MADELPMHRKARYAAEAKAAGAIKDWENTHRRPADIADMVPLIVEHCTRERLPKVVMYDADGDYLAVYVDGFLEFYYHRPGPVRLLEMVGIHAEMRTLPAELHDDAEQTLAEMEVAVAEVQKRAKQAEIRRLKEEIQKLEAE